MRYIVLSYITFLSVSCAVSNHSVSNDDPSGLKTNKTNLIDEVNTPYPALELIDYLRRVPGIQVITAGGTPQVRIRSGVSFMGESEPLYVIDNIRVGNDYSAAAASVDVNDIKSISVIKDVSSTSFYGFQGANGVIIIHTKKQ